MKQWLMSYGHRRIHIEVRMDTSPHLNLKISFIVYIFSILTSICPQLSSQSLSPSLISLSLSSQSFYISLLLKIRPCPLEDCPYWPSVLDTPLVMTMLSHGINFLPQLKRNNSDPLFYY